MRVAVLGSGSGGNSLVVESAGSRLLIDAGFSRRQIVQRLEMLQQDAADLDALLLTHEHQDHCRGVEVMVRQFGLPIYATEGTQKGFRFNPTTQAEIHTVRSGQPFEVPARSESDSSPPRPAFLVEAFGVPHDAREPVGFVVEDQQGHRLGLVADLGCRSHLAWARLHDLDCLVIETNHDLSMLRNGPYPWHLKQRVASRHGHLSNREAAEGLVELVSDRLSFVFLYHLSRTNNSPALAAEAVGEKLSSVGAQAEIVLTAQDAPTSWVEIPPAAGCLSDP